MGGGRSGLAESRRRHPFRGGKEIAIAVLTYYMSENRIGRNSKKEKEEGGQLGRTDKLTREKNLILSVRKPNSKKKRGKQRR